MISLVIVFAIPSVKPGRRGVSLEKIAALAGHDSLETTRRYCELSSRLGSGCGTDWRRRLNEVFGQLFIK
jgi:hypothetical protein